MTTRILAQIPHRDVRKGETRVLCIGCGKLGEPVKNPSGSARATTDDMKTIIEQHEAKGWKADLAGPRCPTCAALTPYKPGSVH